MLNIWNPMEIETKSFEIISDLLGNRSLPEDQDPIIKRVIHTTADLDYADNLKFSQDAVRRGTEALKAGCCIVTDTQMAMAGINKSTLGKLGASVRCFISDEDVALEAKQRNVTRSLVSMERAAELDKRCIFAIGNAPTALLRIVELAQEGKLQPALVIGVPVGFVNVVESKEQLMASGLPYIAAKGRKGGSNVAAAVCNALMYRIQR